jgi:hypothetical protein
MTPTFQPASRSSIESVYGVTAPLGALSTSVSDAISVARQTYDKSDLAKRAIADFMNVKDRNALAAYVAPKLRILVSFTDNDAVGTKAAEQLRYLSVTNSFSIGDFISNNLAYVLKYGPSKDKIDAKKAIAYWNANLSKMYFFNSKEKEAIKQLAREYELEDVKRQARDEAEAALRRESGSSAAASGLLNSALLGKTWTDGTYTYKIDASGTVVTGGKTFSKSDAKYAAVAANLNNDFVNGRLRSGSAPARSYTPTPSLPTAPETTDVSVPGLQQEASLTDAWWFWPSVGLGTIAVAGGVYWAFLRNKE